MPLWPRANGRLEVVRTMALTLGPALEGMIVGYLGGGFVFALSFALSLLSVLLLRGIQEPVRVVQRHHLWTEMAEGAVFVAGDVYSLRYERIGLSASGVGMTMGFLGLGMFVGLSARPK